MTEKNLKAFQPRKHHRYKVQKKVLICVKGICGTVETKDISDGGMAINMLTAENLPDIKLGSIVSTRPADVDSELPKVGKVVRLDGFEAGIEFVS